MPGSRPWVVMCPEASGLQMGSPHQPGARHGLQGMGDTAPPPTGSHENWCLMWKVPKGRACCEPLPTHHRKQMEALHGRPPKDTAQGLQPTVCRASGCWAEL